MKLSSDCAKSALPRLTHALADYWARTSPSLPAGMPRGWTVRSERLCLHILPFVAAVCFEHLTALPARLTDALDGLSRVSGQPTDSLPSIQRRCSPVQLHIWRYSTLKLLAKSGHQTKNQNGQVSATMSLTSISTQTSSLVSLTLSKKEQPAQTTP